MDLPEGCTVRRPTPADVSACCALVIATDIEEYGEPDYEESDVVDDWARDRFDLDRDSWLVEDADGRLVGYANAWDKRPHELVIAELSAHPDGPDLYPWLVDAISRRSAEHAEVSGRTTTHVYNSEPNLRRARALTDAGYAVVRVFRRMVADLTEPPPSPDPAPGVVIRPVTPDDLPAVYEVQQESFASHFDFVRASYETWRKTFVESASYRPELWWLAEVDGKPTGVLIGQRHDENGWVKTVGVLDSARGRGAGTALLLTAFARFHADRCPQVGLGVDSDNTTGAMALYERIGMRAQQRYDLYERVFTRS
jgi:ribosomal protein S18 acetylase RimI-like enzyme